MLLFKVWTKKCNKISQKSHILDPETAKELIGINPQFEIENATIYMFRYRTKQLLFFEKLSSILTLIFEYLLTALKWTNLRFRS